MYTYASADMFHDCFQNDNVDRLVKARPNGGFLCCSVADPLDALNQLQVRGAGAGAQQIQNVLDQAEERGFLMIVPFNEDVLERALNTGRQESVSGVLHEDYWGRNTDPLQAIRMVSLFGYDQVCPDFALFELAQA